MDAPSCVRVHVHAPVFVRARSSLMLLSEACWWKGRGRFCGSSLVQQPAAEHAMDGCRALPVVPLQAGSCHVSEGDGD